MRFYLYVVASFIYSGLSFCAIKFCESSLRNVFTGKECYVVAMSVVFMVLTALSGVKFNELRLNAEKNPLKVFDMMYQMIYITFLFATLYLLFNVSVITVIPKNISDILMLCTWKINLPITLLVLTVMLKSKEKTVVIKKAPIYIVVCIAIVSVLSVMDIITFGIIFAFGNMNIFKCEYKVVNKITFIASLTGMLMTLSLIYYRSWILMIFSLAVNVIVFLKETNLNALKNDEGEMCYEKKTSIRNNSSDMGCCMCNSDIQRRY